ncbi:MAG: GGDEF domain-containing protein [Candidatus Korobacteraceae bacterium]
MGDYAPRVNIDRRTRHALKRLLALVALLTLSQISATLLVPRSFSLSVINDSVELLLILSAVFVFSLNASLSTKQVRLFWLLLAASWGARIVVQAMWMYFELVLRKEAPNPFVGDILLFLSEIPVLAALLLQPALDQVERRKATSRVDFLLLLLWWLYLYLFFVIPWQYVVPNEGRYGWNYNQLSGCLDVVILLTIAFQWAHRSGQRRWFYAAFFGSQLLLAIAAYVANLAIDRHIYYPGSWYDLPYAAALASVTIVGLVGHGLAPDKGSRGKALPLNQLGIVAVLSLPVITAGTLLASNEPWAVVRFRELVAQVTVFVMASLLFVRQRQLRDELARSNRANLEASLSDPLTGARNRRFFDETICGDTSQILRSHVTAQNINSRDMIFYMVDLDRLKEVNDGYGHHAGDNVLKEVTNRIAAVIRSSDILVRWGGDEFLIVSRYADRREAEVLALRILLAVGASHIAVQGDGIAVLQTCSIGWAAFPWHPDDPKAVSIEVVLSLADRGAYEAKAAGRNRAIGVLPAKDSSLFFATAAEDHSAKYPVQITCVEGTSQAKEALAVV